MGPNGDIAGWVEVKQRASWATLSSFAPGFFPLDRGAFVESVRARNSQITVPYQGGNDGS